MVRKMLVKVLVRLGSAVDEACDGQVAIDIIRGKLRVKDEEREDEGEKEEKEGGALPVVGVVTHGEMIRAVYEALGQGAYSPLNTQVVPIMIDQLL